MSAPSPADAVPEPERNEEPLIINCRSTRAASDLAVAAEVSKVLERRAAMSNPPASLTISDATALGVAAIFAGPTPSGLVFQRFSRTGSVDGDELVEAARVEQGYASPEGHAALYCLIGWARAQQSRMSA